MQTRGKWIFVLGFVLGLSAGTPSRASAGSIADRPLPTLPGSTKPARHVYSVAGVMNTPGITTSFHCTSTEKTGGKDIQWGVEAFEDEFLRNDVTAAEGVATLVPGETDIISIDDTAVFLENDDLGDPSVTQGSARILAESPKIICTAFLVDTDNNPPTFITTLPVFKKTTQKGQ